MFGLSLSLPVSLFLVSSCDVHTVHTCGGCGPVGQTTETIMGRRDRECTRYVEHTTQGCGRTSLRATSVFISTLQKGGAEHFYEIFLAGKKCYRRQQAQGPVRLLRSLYTYIAYVFERGQHDLFGVSRVCSSRSRPLWAHRRGGSSHPLPILIPVRPTHVRSVRK